MASTSGGASKGTMIKAAIAAVLLIVAGVLLYLQFGTSSVGPTGTTGLDEKAVEAAKAADPAKAPAPRGGHRAAPGG